MILFLGSANQQKEKQNKKKKKEREEKRRGETSRNQERSYFCLGMKMKDTKK